VKPNDKLRIAKMLGWKTVVVAVAVGVGAFLMNRPHCEDALMVDWSNPPPLPIFIAVNALAGLLRHMADALTPPPIRMLDIAFGYHSTMFAQICQKFTIPDFLATGPKTVEEIALHMQTKDVSRVERIMYAMASEGMTQLDTSAKSKNGNIPRFVNTALSAVLRTDHPNSMRGTVGHTTEDTWSVWGSLPLMFGSDAIDQVWDVAWPQYPLEEGGIWSLYEADKSREEQFGRAMMGIESRGGWAMAVDGPFSKFGRYIDVGGNNGHFLYKVLQLNPNKQGILYDRDHVVLNARKLWEDPSGPYFAEKNAVFVSGDFFQEGSIPEAQDDDLYYMRYILHDWPAEKSLIILKNIRAKMGNKKATLLIGESAVPDRTSVGSPSAIHHIDIQMMAVFGDALERTPKMWKELLNQAGFDMVAIHPTRSIVHWVEAVPRE
jgi:hypothetical protein